MSHQKLVKHIAAAMTIASSVPAVDNTTVLSIDGMIIGKRKLRCLENTSFNVIASSTNPT
jgi:hypothetical protein